MPPQCRIGGQPKIKNQKPCRRHSPNHFADAKARSLVNLKSQIKNQKSFDRPSAGSVVNLKSKISNLKSSRCPPSAGSGVNLKSKIKNLKSSRCPPSAGSGVNQKSQITNLVADLPQIISRTLGPDRSSI